MQESSIIPVYLSIGSNLGDPMENCRQAVELLAHHPDFSLTGQAHYYLTEPQDVHNQPWFCNTVISGLTTMSPYELLFTVKTVEATLGRKRLEIAKGPRPIDIDILIWGTEQINQPSLIIPHPKMMTRRFVLEPLMELAPHLIVPGTNFPVKYFYKRLARLQGSQEVWSFSSGSLLTGVE